MTRLRAMPRAVRPFTCAHYSQAQAQCHASPRVLAVRIARPLCASVRKRHGCALCAQPGYHMSPTNSPHAPHACVADDANGHSCREASQTASQAGGKVRKAVEQPVALDVHCVARARGTQARQASLSYHCVCVRAARRAAQAHAWRG
jgi:hypothetical protein